MHAQDLAHHQRFNLLHTFLDFTTHQLLRIFTLDQKFKIRLSRAWRHSLDKLFYFLFSELLLGLLNVVRLEVRKVW